VKEHGPALAEGHRPPGPVSPRATIYARSTTWPAMGNSSRGPKGYEVRR
jgi:hypothetical protein